MQIYFGKFAQIYFSLTIKEVLSKAWTYSQYTELLNVLVAEGKTTGDSQSDKMAEYTRLNLVRMQRNLKTLKLQPGLTGNLLELKDNLTWLVLTEGWCGDAAHSVPVMHLMTEITDKIKLLLVSRDEHPDLMNTHLTNGTRSIPILICYNDKLEELGSWGPRPAPAQQMLADYKKNPGESYDSFKLRIQQWYNKDKSLTMQSEFRILLDQWKKKQ